MSGASKNRVAEDPHVDDARIAVVEFQRRLRAGELTSDVDEPTVLNLAAAGLIASGLTSRVELLKEPCIVVKPAAYGGAA